MGRWSMRDRTVVVTGCSRGLGFEFCRQLKGLGARVIATARDPKRAVDLRALQLPIETLDVADDASVATFAKGLGDTPVDMLINNAGMGGAGNGIASLELANLEAFFQINYLGAVRVTQALLPNLRRAKGRRIIQISTRMGSVSDNSEGGYYGYRASKAALNMFHRCLAAELGGQGFVCVALNPGWARTRMGGSRAPLSPESSVSGMLNVIAHLDRSDNGKFLDYTGSTVPW